MQPSSTASCGARTRNGTSCSNPPVKGKKRCRMHGAFAGAPEGPRNGNYRHGRRSRAYLERQREAYLAANPWIAQLHTIQELLACADELKRTER